MPGKRWRRARRYAVLFPRSWAIPSETWRPLLSRLNFHRKTGNLSLITVHKIIREKGEKNDSDLQRDTDLQGNECCVHSTMKKADRVPIGYFANPGIKSALRRLLGVPADKDSLNDALGVDFKGLMPAYTRESLCSRRRGRSAMSPAHRAVTRWVANEDGGYWDHCDFPLAEADDETIANWPVPDPDDFDYDGLLEKLQKLYGHKAVYFGHPGISDVMNNTGMIRGMENIYMDLALETESVMTLLDRRMKAPAELAMFERALDKCRDYVDFIWTGEDLGTQRAPLISLDMFRAQIRPRHQPLVDRPPATASR